MMGINKICIYILLVLSVFALSCKNKPLYDKEDILMKYLHEKHDYILEQENCGLLVYRKPFACSQVFDEMLINDLNIILSQQKPSVLYVISDFAMVNDSVKKYTRYNNIKYIVEDYYCLDRYGFEISPKLFIINKKHVVFWKKLIPVCEGANSSSTGKP